MQQIKNYEQAKAYLGNKKERPYAHNTRIEIDSLDLGHEVITVKYHGNPVVNMFPDGTNSYDSCGWKTPTTKERINWFLPDGFTLYQEKSTWYIADRREGWERAKTYVFADGLAIKWGTVYNAADESEQEQIKKTIKAIKRYVDGYTKALLSGNVPAPSGGDCWYCFMSTEDGQSLGEATNNRDHIESHIEESYYVPSLLMNAAKNGKLSDFARSAIYQLWSGESISDWQVDITARQVKSCLISYLKHSLGIAQ